MVEPLDVKPILGKLLEKSHQDRVPWELGPGGNFVCSLGEFHFEVYETRDGYGFRMADQFGKDLIRFSVVDEIIFDKPEKQDTFEEVRDLHELARRKALQIPEKLATASALLDSI